MTKKTDTPVPTALKPFDIHTKKNWKLYVDGNEVEINEIAYLYNKDKNHQLTIGANEFNTDQWAFHENKGGGSVTCLYTIVDNQLWIGLSEQERKLQSTKNVLNIPRGFVEPQEKHDNAAKREIYEELGITGQKPVLLEGEPGNPNPTFWETWTEGEGVRFFALYISPSKLVKEGDRLYFANGINPRKDPTEKILDLVFIPWQEATKLGDMITLATITRLLNFLNDNGDIKISFDKVKQV